ncbi:MAG: hypothetical protein DMF93_22635 [Acidobacteria bacterium]|nr:MAG: hypothetical protein DMF93_22635 [Acidobacteriota bacterium]
MRTAITIVVALVLLAGAARLQAVRERWYPPALEEETAMYLESAAAVRRISGPYAPLVADLYWIRAIQYYGGTKRRLSPAQGGDATSGAGPGAASPTDDRYALLYPMLDITTTLDPRFNIAYRFGAIFLAEAYPNGAGRPDLAVQLLQKGLRDRPDKWEYMEDIAFVHYWYEHDYLAASQWFEKGAEAPGAPWWLRSMAATTRARGGDRAASRLTWETIRQTTEIPFLRQDAEQKLLQLRALDEIDALQQVVDQVKARTGAAPEDWASLVRARVLRGIPVDPRGTPYELAPDGRVRLSSSSRLYPLLVEPPSGTERR